MGWNGVILPINYWILVDDKEGDGSTFLLQVTVGVCDSFILLSQNSI